MDFLNRLKNFKSVFFKKELEMLIFFVTTRCNAQCRTCFYWKNLNRLPDISLLEIKNTSEKLGNFRNLLFSGGEPFLRKDLVEIVDVFVKKNKIENLSIPTNAVLTTEIIKTSSNIIKKYPLLNVSVNVSLDGLKETHDRIRGIKGNFEVATRTIRELLRLKKNLPNFNVVVNTVISRENYQEIETLARFLKDNFYLDGHSFEVIRGSPKYEGLLEIPIEELARIYKNIVPIQVFYFEKSLASKKLGSGFLGFLRRLIREGEFLGCLLYQYKTQYNNYAFAKNWSVPCLAGKLIKVLDSNGKLRDCELREKKGRDCFCTHICFINISSLFNWKSYFFEFPYLFLRYKIFKRVL